MAGYENVLRVLGCPACTAVSDVDPARLDQLGASMSKYQLADVVAKLLNRNLMWREFNALTGLSFIQGKLDPVLNRSIDRFSIQLERAQSSIGFGLRPALPTFNYETLSDVRNNFYFSVLPPALLQKWAKLMTPTQAEHLYVAFELRFVPGACSLEAFLQDPKIKCLVYQDKERVLIALLLVLETNGMFELFETIIADVLKFPTQITPEMEDVPIEDVSTFVLQHLRQEPEFPQLLRKISRPYLGKTISDLQTLSREMHRKQQRLTVGHFLDVPVTSFDERRMHRILLTYVLTWRSNVHLPVQDPIQMPLSEQIHLPLAKVHLPILDRWSSASTPAIMEQLYTNFGLRRIHPDRRATNLRDFLVQHPGIGDHTVANLLELCKQHQFATLFQIITDDLATADGIFL